MNILLVYENVPDNTIVYYFPDATPQIEQILRDAHGTYVNHNDNDASQKLYEILELPEDERPWLIAIDGTDPDQPPAGPFLGGIDLIVKAGFCL